MLVIRMQRTGRKGHAQFRVIVQDSRRTPTSGKIVAPLGSYDPHSKQTTLNKEKAQFYLEHGAQPSERVAAILKAEGVKLPKCPNRASSSCCKRRASNEHISVDGCIVISECAHLSVHTIDTLSGLGWIHLSMSYWMYAQQHCAG